MALALRSPCPTLLNMSYAVLTRRQCRLCSWCHVQIQAMIEDNGKGEAVEQQRRWLRVHTVRTLTVDLGAWLACLIAVARTVS